LLLVGCASVNSTSGDDTMEATLSITIEKRPTVRGVRSITISLTNNGAMTSDRVDLNDLEFPAVYTVSARGKSGPLEITIEALDGVGTLVGRGARTTSFGNATVGVMVDGVDFVVNSVFAGSQFTTNDFETVGLQIAASPFGEWTVGFREDCSSCTIHGRTFDSLGQPIGGQFPFATMLTNASTPALTAGADRSAVLWDFVDPNTSAPGIGCRTFGFGGLEPPLTVVNEAADVVTAAPLLLQAGRFVVTWQAFTTTQVIRSMIVSALCEPLTTPVTVSIATGASGARRSHVAVSDFGVLYTWIVDGSVHARFGSDTGMLAANETVLIARTPMQEVEFVRVVRWGNSDRYAVAVRWTSTAGQGPGKIEVYPLTGTGALGAPTLITDASGSDFASAKAFGIAARYDGLLMVVWHACPSGPGTCDVFGRYVAATGDALDAPFVVPTATAADQTNPSVAVVDNAFVIAWTDSSGVAPDPSGSAVRARIMLPAP
jgi:hypothetical protein